MSIGGKARDVFRGVYRDQSMHDPIGNGMNSTFILREIRNF